MKFLTSVEVFSAGLILLNLTTGIASVPLSQFFPFGDTAGDLRLNLGDDSSAGPYTLTTTYTILGRQINSLYVNSNGVVSFFTGFTEYSPHPFPIGQNQTLLCPFWDDVNIRVGGRIYYQNSAAANSNTRHQLTQLIRESFGISFTATGVSIATWDHVAHYSGTSAITNTFQCVLATDGASTFVIFLYADDLMNWNLHGAQIGINGGDGTTYFSVPGALTNNLSIETTSNVDRPGVWIFKVDTDIIAGKSTSAPRDVYVRDVGTTTISLQWEYNQTADNFTVTCELEDDVISSQTSTSNSVTIRNLSAYTNYTCYISATNIFGTGPASDGTHVHTNPDAPSGTPLSVQTTSVTARTVHLEWLPPAQDQQNGVILGYIIYLNSTVTGEVYTTSNTTLEVDSLRPFTVYHYTLAAYTSVGTGPATTPTPVQTAQDAPSGTPLSVQTTNVSATTVHLEWLPPAQHQQNGVILGYIINLNSTVTGEVYNTSNTTLEVSSLRPFTVYHYTLAAYTSVGTGPATTPTPVQTAQDVPSGAPQDITAVVNSSTSFLLKWSPPLEEHQNGVIIGYRIIVEWDMREVYDEVNTSDTTHTLTALQEDTTYYYSLAAYTVMGVGPYSNRTPVTTLKKSGGINLTAVGSAGGAGLLIAVLIAVVLMVTCIIFILIHKHKRERTDEHIYEEPDVTIKGIALDKEKTLAVSTSSHYVNTYKSPISPPIKAVDLNEATTKEPKPDKDTVTAYASISAKQPRLPPHQQPYLEESGTMKQMVSQLVVPPKPLKRMDGGGDRKAAYTVTRCESPAADSASSHYMLLSQTNRENQHYMSLSDATRLDRGEHVMVSTQEQTVHYQNTSGHRYTKGSAIIKQKIQLHK